MANKHGSLSIDSDNLFPIIKKWLYSDHDIFYRELVSNGCDAITKLKKLDMMGEYTLPEDFKPQIQIIVNPEEKTLKFIDNGLGMTADEVEEYICRIAFSGATDFIQKYKDNNDWLSHFLEDCCEVDPSYEAKSGEVYNAYRSYCNQMGEYIRSTTDFYTAIESADFTRHKTKTGMMIHGFRLKSDFME